VSVRGVPALYRLYRKRTSDLSTVLSSGFHVLEDEVFASTSMHERMNAHADEMDRGSMRRCEGCRLIAGSAHESERIHVCHIKTRRIYQ
jgi:hypothetical protein